MWFKSAGFYVPSDCSYHLELKMTVAKITNTSAGINRPKVDFSETEKIGNHR